MPPISLMLKPASGKCNLRCKYCFYHDVASNREIKDKGFLSDELLDTILKKAFEYADGKQVLINFQGGEPLLSGKTFMRGVVSKIREINKKGSPVFLGLQTNGTLIDDEWCEIFKENNFLVGLSLDGDKIANRNRVDINGIEVFDKILNAAKLLEKHNVEFNILSVLTAENAVHIDRIYSFFKKEGLKKLQFIPCLKPLNEEVEDESFYLDSKSYETFLIKAFALYKQDMASGNYVSIRQFDNFVNLAHFQRAEQCGMNGYCTHQFVIEADGTVYPCDFYCIDEYCLGNIKDSSFSELEHSKIAMDFIKESLETPDKCKKCEFYMLCRGGCKRERKDIDKCEAYKTFFKLVIPHLKRMS